MHVLRVINRVMLIQRKRGWKVAPTVLPADKRNTVLPTEYILII